MYSKKFKYLRRFTFYLYDYMHTFLKVNSCIFMYVNFSILKTFTQNKEDRKKVEKAMESSGLPSNKVRKYNEK